MGFSSVKKFVLETLRESQLTSAEWILSVLEGGEQWQPQMKGIKKKDQTMAIRLNTPLAFSRLSQRLIGVFCGECLS